MSLMKRRETQIGLAVLVGAGPHEESLMTRAALRWIKSADTVIYDRLVNRSILSHCRADAELIYAGKVPGEAALTQQQISALLVEKCRVGKLVVRLKGGDPFVFGRGGEEAEALAAAHLPYRIVPGVTAAVAAGAYAGIPLTDRRRASSVVFVTGREDPDKGESSIDYDALAKIDTVVFYMGVGNLSELVRRLTEAGRDGRTPVAVVADATSPRQRTVVATLATIVDNAQSRAVSPPAVVIIGDVAAMHDRLQWFEKLPLFGLTVLVTRPAGQAAEMCARLREYGAEAVAAPAIEIAPPESFDAVDGILRRLGEFDWLVFTSANGAAALFDRLEALGMDGRALGGVKVAAVGPATAAALRQRTIRPDLVPRTFTTDALAKALCAEGALGSKRMLLARADIARGGLAEQLSRAGAIVEQVCVYRTLRPAALPQEATEALLAGRTDWITLTSSAAVENLLSLVDCLDVNLTDTRFAAIGPVTAKTLISHGLQPAVVADPHTTDAMVSGIVRFQEGLSGSQ